MNPGSPAPQASVIIRTRLRAQTTRLAPSPKVKGKIVNTLVKLKNSGLQEKTVKIVGFYLKHLAVNSDLSKPECVKEFISNKKVNNGFKGNLVKAYGKLLNHNFLFFFSKFSWAEQTKNTKKRDIISY